MCVCALCRMWKVELLKKRERRVMIPSKKSKPKKFVKLICMLFVSLFS